MNEESKPDDERRRFQRVDTQRNVIFSDYHATGPLREGTVIDMSAGGLRILTRNPEEPNTDIQMELKPTEQEPDASVVLLEGRVKHVLPMEDGQYFMGVQRLHRGMASSGATPRPYTRGAATPMPMIKDPLAAKREVEPNGGAVPNTEEANSPALEPDQSAEEAQPAYRYPTPRPQQRKVIGPFGIFSLAFLLILVAVAVVAIVKLL